MSVAEEIEAPIAAAAEDQPEVSFSQFWRLYTNANGELGPKWSKFIPEYVKPTPKQNLALSLGNARDLLYGGAAGGGKSEFLLCAGLQYVDIPGYSSLILRKHMTDLKLNQALLHRAMTWLSPWIDEGLVVYKPEIYTFEFDTFYADGSPGEPSRLQFGFLGKGSANVRYQGAEFQFIGVDEAGQHVPRDLTYMFSRLRKKVCVYHGKNADPFCIFCAAQNAIPLRYRLTANPGDIGHEFLKKRYVIQPAINLRDGNRHEGHIPFLGKNPKKPFIPSYWFDNPYVDESYKESLEETTGVDKEHLMAGNWNASPDARFKMEWAKYYHVYRDQFIYTKRDEHGNEIARYVWNLKDLWIFTTSDPASTAREGPGDSQIFDKGAPSETVFSTWGLTPERILLWLDCVTFSIEIPDILEEAQAVYRIWRPKDFLCEVNGVGAGIYQPLSRIGLPMRPIRKHKDKVTNATQALVRFKGGRIILPSYAPWLEKVEGQLFTWFGHPYQADDIIDTLSDAANHIAEVTNVWYEPEEITVDNILQTPLCDYVGNAVYADDDYAPSIDDIVI